MNKQGENLIVIVVTHNRLEYTKITIESILRTVPMAKILICENGIQNTDKYKWEEYIEDLSKRENDAYHVRICSTGEETVGWGTAINFSLQSIKLMNMESEYILLSNNDVEYKDGWYEKALTLYEKYPKIGILGLWKHTAHGVKQEYEDVVVKDQMPAVAWLMKPEVLKDIGEVAEHGVCLTKGGNGEDVDYCIRAEQKGYLVVGPREDLALHLDGY